MKKLFIYLVSMVYICSTSIAQIDTLNNVFHPTLSGIILNKNNTPLPYVNIISLNTGKGTISNENGCFSIDVFSLNDTNIIRFQCIGYKTKDYKIENLKSKSIILLSENIYALNEVMILGTTPNPEEIVKNILLYKDSNYRITNHRKHFFKRYRSSIDLLNFKLDFKKSSMPTLTSEVIQKIEENTPKHTQSHYDILAILYIKEKELKLDPIKAVKLKQKDITEMDVFLDPLKKAVSLNDGEYLRIKSGILGTNKVSISISDSSKATIKDYRKYLKNNLKFSTFEDEDEWEFLHKTNKYNFEIIGGTSVNNESVYIIDFTPKKRGLYQGRLYVSVETSALIRADYKYAPNKLGKDFHILGVGYTETNFSGSIYFENNNNNYNLKYFSFQESSRSSVKRKVTLLKKKKKFLINKKLNAIKIGLDIIQEYTSSVEFMVIDNNKISEQDYDNFEEEKYIDIININQFDKSIWENHTTIEPTQQMKEYKKIE